MTNYKHNPKRKIQICMTNPIFFPNSGLLSIGALILQKVFSEIPGKTLLNLTELKIFQSSRSENENNAHSRVSREVNILIKARYC